MEAPIKKAFIKLEHLLFLLLVFFLPTQLGKHFWPEFSVLSGIRIDYLSPTLYFTDVIILLLFFTWLTGRFFLRVNPLARIRSELAGEHNHSSKDNSLLLLGSAVFIISAVIGIGLSDSPQAGLFGLLKISELFFLAFIASQLLTIEKNFLKTILIFASSMLIQSILATAQFLNQGSIGGLFYYIGERTFTSFTPGIANASLNGVLVLRPYGTLPHPNVLAGYLLMGIILITGNYKMFIQKREKVLLSLSLIVSTLVLFLSMSRSAIFIALVLAVFSLIKQLKSSGFRSNKAFVMLLALVFTINIVLLSPISHRFYSVDISNESVAQRMVLALASLKMFREHPFFGVGLSNFLIKLPGYISVNQAPIQPVHNIYLLILAENGIIILSLVIIFIYIIFSKTRKINNGINYLALIFFAILLLGMNDHYLSTLQQGKLLLTISISIIYARNRNTFGLKRGKFNRNKLAQNRS